MEFWQLDTDEGDMDNKEVLEDSIIKSADLFNTTICWNLLKLNKILFDKKELQILFEELFSISQIDILLAISPISKNESSGLYFYIHKSFYEYFIALGIIEDIQNFN